MAFLFLTLIVGQKPKAHRTAEVFEPAPASGEAKLRTRLRRRSGCAELEPRPRLSASLATVTHLPPSAHSVHILSLSSRLFLNSSNVTLKTVLLPMPLSTALALYSRHSGKLALGALLHLFWFFFFLSPLLMLTIPLQQCARRAPALLVFVPLRLGTKTHLSPTPPQSIGPIRILRSWSRDGTF